ncbi:TDP-N-acetylfucosamine:lipid II N-acetylfucosaminyltransferase [Flavobacterium sp.]
MKDIIHSFNKGLDGIVFFHALDHIKQEVALDLHDKIKKVWFIWGYDLYEKWPLLKYGNYENETKLLIENNKTKKQYFIHNQLVYKIFEYIVKLKITLPVIFQKAIDANYNTSYLQAVNKMDIVVPVIPLEYNIAKKINNRLIYAPFTYGYIEDLLRDNIDKNVKKSSNILVGNSANPTNNHLDVFKKLREVSIQNRKIYVPLSYSGSQEYIDKVIEKGKELWGDNFIPITDFISLEKYNEILLSCNVLIFNHIRQQGVGNIIALGYLGAKIYLNPKNPVYQFYKQEGISIYSIKEINTTSLEKEVSMNEYLNNKKIFLNLYSKEKVIEKTKKLFQIVQNLKK